MRYLDDFRLPLELTYDAAWRRAMVGGDGFDPIGSTSDPEAGDVLLLRAGRYDFAQRIEIVRAVQLRGAGHRNTTIRFIGAEAGIRIRFRGNCPDWHAKGYGAWSMISDLGLLGDGPKGNGQDGLWVEARVDVRNVHVANFSGHGVRVDADINRTPEQGGPSGASACSFLSVRSTGNQGNGWHFRGGDANECVLIDCDASSNEGWGYFDESFLGNNGLGVHAANNTQGSLHAMRESQRGRWMIYCESGGGAGGPGSNTEGRIFCRPPNLLINPRASAPHMQGSPAMIAPNTSQMLLSSFGTIQPGADAGPVSASLGDTDPRTALAFVDKVNDPSGVFRLKLGEKTLKGLWALLYKGASSLASWGVTTLEHPRGPGHLVAPRGILIGSGEDAMQIQVCTSEPKAAPGQRAGDLAIRPGLPLSGWVFDGQAWQPTDTKEDAK